ncbi:GNAT family N-acetyltransferase [Bordetella holmesii]|uniref:GNAT family N-acetyltransferase n=1 Tax=Bordetella holmesii TaxID=35814 RepID=UPI000C76BFA5|nr:GNAT family N-acetyltransferase [Bordetella holmesii]AUL20930.1 GNAT family N-acetyltransferase [Bordetella holmesii]AUL52262.1 GNAT family N-acetyltransferase [Bordetella holmesii]
MNPSLTPFILIRSSAEQDLAQIQAIYAHHVVHGTSSFELEPPSTEEIGQRRAAVLQHGLPYLVAECGGDIVGYAYATVYRPRPAYRHTCEDSVYVRNGRHGLGIGRKLLEALIEHCTGQGWRQMLAVIGDNNPASLGLHARCGFQVAGTLRAVGFKHGKWRDTALMQRALGAGDLTPPED